MLTPPAIVEPYRQHNGIESRLAALNSLQENSRRCDISYKKGILNELARPLEISHFFDGKMYYEFMAEPKNGPLVAVQVYVAKDNKPTQLQKVVYFRRDGTLVVYYYDKGSIFPSKCNIDWTKIQIVRCIEKDDGSHETQVKDAYNSY